MTFCVLKSEPPNANLWLGAWTESEENSLKSAKDPLDTEVLVSQHKCESLCCTNDKPFQPLDKSYQLKRTEISWQAGIRLIYGWLFAWEKKKFSVNTAERWKSKVCLHFVKEVNWLPSILWNSWFTSQGAWRSFQSPEWFFGTCVGSWKLINECI